MIKLIRFPFKDRLVILGGVYWTPESKGIYLPQIKRAGTLAITIGWSKR